MSNNIREKYPEWCKKPFRLNLEEIESPYLVLKDFFREYPFPGIRDSLRNLLTDAMESECPLIDHFYLCEGLERLLEAVSILHQGKEKESIIKSNREQAIEEYVGILAHELNTMMSGIKQAIDSVEAFKDESSGRYGLDATYYFDIVKAISGEAINVLSNMRTHAQFSGGNLEIGLQKETFHIPPFINSFFLPFSLYKNSVNKKLIIKIQPPARGQITTDKVKLTQIIYNLLHNAFKFSIEETNVTLDCDWNNSRLIIKICNISEYHIPSGEKEAIFEPYKQLEGGSAGTGLGLYICKLYAKLLGGNISVESRDSGLIIFTVDVPDHI